MPDQTLATFVHVSDLHLDTPEAGSGSARVPAHWRATGWFNGFFGHSFGACSALVEAFADLQDDEDAVLVFTGDLTAHGRPAQFTLGRDFLGGRAAFGSRHLGLQVQDWRDRAVPGNHDQWPGWPGGPWILGWPSPGLSQTYHVLPESTVIPLSQGAQVRLLAIDTDHEVGPFSPARFFAQGQFKAHLSDLSQDLDRLGPPADGEVRVLLLHHGPSHRGRLHVGEILEPSRTDLVAFLQRHKVSVTLSGHTHYPRVVVERARTPSGPVRYLDAQCGSSTQLAQLPAHWQSGRDRRRQAGLRPNTLLVHRLLKREDTLVWSSQTWVYHPRTSRQFAPASSHPALQYQSDLAADLQVWP